MNMSNRTMYVKSIEVLNPRYVEAYTYRRQGENLGTLGCLRDGSTWVVADFMNYVEKEFDSKNKAKEFIKKIPRYIYK